VFKPMLATAVEDVAQIKFPVLASQKLDGIRATVQEGRLMSRSLKPIPNVHVQRLFAGLPEGLDGELILGDPLAADCYRKTVSLVMSDDKPLPTEGDTLRFHVFDVFREYAGFHRRLKDSIGLSIGHAFVRNVEHFVVANLAELERMEENLLERGAEGVMLRSLEGPYKQGRSSLREGYLLKLKRFKDCEATIINTFELMHNDNEAFKNELGRTARSQHQDNLKGLDTLGGLIVAGLGGDYDGVEFRVGTGFDAATRKDLWALRLSLPGQIVKVKYFPSGGKDKPRHPVFLGFRDKRDM
jgi:DNA ligase 1